MLTASIVDQLPFRNLLHRSSSRAQPKRGSLLAASWDQSNIYYLVVKQSKQALTATSWGRIARDGATGTPLKQLEIHLQDQKKSLNRLLLLLPRTDLEMTTVEIPPADADEVPALIQAEIEQQIGDSDHELVVDYRLLDGATPPPVGVAAATDPGSHANAMDDVDLDTPSSQTAVAFSLEQQELDQWKQRAAASGLQLVGFTSRQVAPLYHLRQKRHFRAPLSILIVVYEGEVELSFFRGSRLASLRTFRVGSDDVTSLSEQIQIEVQRSISLMEFVRPGEMPELIVLVRSPRDAAATNHSPHSRTSKGDTEDSEFSEEAETLASALDARVVSLSLPRDPSSQQDIDSEPPDPVLVAAADVHFFESLAIDLVNPKRSPVPPNPLKRWALIGTLGAIAFAVVTYLMLVDVRELREQVDARKQDLAEAEKIAAKMQEKADETRLVQQWSRDQVDWLSQLRLLSKQFPSGQTANVRRLSASASGNVGVFDLSIQVNDPKRVAELENRLRDANFSITSKQISEQANNEEYPWQFQATIAFQIPTQDEEDLEDLFQPSGTATIDNISERGSISDAAYDNADDAPVNADDESVQVPELDTTDPEATESEATESEATESELTESELTELELTEEQV